MPVWDPVSQWKAVLNPMLVSRSHTHPHTSCQRFVLSQRFGAVGAVTGIDHPIEAAYQVMKLRQKQKLSFGRIPPLLLAGAGAYEFAKSCGLSVSDAGCLREHHVTASNRHQWSLYHRTLQSDLTPTISHSLSEPASDSIHNHRPLKRTRLEESTSTSTLECASSTAVVKEQHGTIGAVCCDRYGNMFAATSSGGIWMKMKGRIGHAAVYGSGCHAMHAPLPSNHAPQLPRLAPAATVNVACSTTGNGEALIEKLFAFNLCQSLVNQSQADQQTSYVDSNGIEKKEEEEEEEDGDGAGLEHWPSIPTLPQVVQQLIHGDANSGDSIASHISPPSSSTSPSSSSLINDSIGFISLRTIASPTSNPDPNSSSTSSTSSTSSSSSSPKEQPPLSVELLWSHTSPHLPIAFAHLESLPTDRPRPSTTASMLSTFSTPIGPPLHTKAFVSTLPNDQPIDSSHIATTVRMFKLR